MSNGVKTSEFWLTLATLLVGGFLVYENSINPQEFLALSIGSGLYSVGRGLAKTEPVERVVK